MEYFKGITLDNFLYENKLTSIQRRQLLREIVDTVVHLHQISILHRDIKPQNILINPETLEIRIIDFGLAVLF